MSKITIVIPTFNNITGLRYLLDYFKDKPYQIIVVDNGKITQSLKLKTQNSKLKTEKWLFLPQEKNLGFAKAVNLGAKYAKTEWLLILNDDVVFEDQKSKIKSQNENLKSKNNTSILIESLINYARNNNLDAVSPILRNSDGKVENAGYKVLAYGKVELIKNPNDKIHIKNQIQNPKSEIINSEVDGLTAACLLIRTEVFKKLVGFDESFFAYLEDVEFFIRFKKKGYRMAVAPITVVHRHMTTTKTMGSFKAWQDMVNWWRLFFKHSDVFRFDFKFLMERGRNITGYLKALIKF